MATQSCESPPDRLPISELIPLVSVIGVGASWLLERSPLLDSFHAVAPQADCTINKPNPIAHPLPVRIASSRYADSLMSQLPGIGNYSHELAHAIMRALE